MIQFQETRGANAGDKCLDTSREEMEEETGLSLDVNRPDQSRCGQDKIVLDEDEECPSRDTEEILSKTS